MSTSLRRQLYKTKVAQFNQSSQSDWIPFSPLRSTELSTTLAALDTQSQAFLKPPFRPYRWFLSVKTAIVSAINRILQWLNPRSGQGVANMPYHPLHGSSVKTLEDFLNNPHLSSKAQEAADIYKTMLVNIAGEQGAKAILERPVTLTQGLILAHQRASTVQHYYVHNTQALLSTYHIPSAKKNGGQHLIYFPDGKHLCEQTLNRYKIYADRGINVTTFNYPGNGFSGGKASSKQVLIDAGIAQVQALIDRGVEAKNITLQGSEVGGGVATAVAEHFKDDGIRLAIHDAHYDLPKQRALETLAANQTISKFRKVFEELLQHFLTTPLGLLAFESPLIESPKVIILPYYLPNRIGGHRGDTVYGYQDKNVYYLLIPHQPDNYSRQQIVKKLQDLERNNQFIIDSNSPVINYCENLLSDELPSSYKKRPYYGFGTKDASRAPLSRSQRLYVWLFSWQLANRWQFSPSDVNKEGYKNRLVTRTLRGVPKPDDQRTRWLLPAPDRRFFAVAQQGKQPKSEAFEDIVTSFVLKSP